jgi:hypothetical protein
MHKKNRSVNEMGKTVDFKSLYERFPELEKQPIVRRILQENVVPHSDLSGECEALIVQQSNRIKYYIFGYPAHSSWEKKWPCAPFPGTHEPIRGA